MRILANVIVDLDNLAHFEVEIDLSLILAVAHLLLELEYVQVELAEVNFVLDACHLQNTLHRCHVHGCQRCRLIVFITQNLLLKFDSQRGLFREFLVEDAGVQESHEGRS